MKIEELADRWLDDNFFMANSGMTYMLSDEKIKHLHIAGIREGLKIALRVLDKEYDLYRDSEDRLYKDVDNKLRDILDGEAEIPNDIPEEVSE